MISNVYALFTFMNSHLVLKAEKTLELENKNIKVIPLPTEISEGCGLSIMCSVDDINSISEILNKNSVPYKKLYSVTKTGLKKEITEMINS